MRTTTSHYRTNGAAITALSVALLLLMAAGAPAALPAARDFDDTTSASGAETRSVFTDVAPSAAVSSEAPTCFGKPATLVASGPGETTAGTAGDDVIVGTTGRDVIRGRGGNDLICGLGGNDVIRGNAGRDRVNAGAGNDRVIGGAGGDLILGGSGRDRLSGSAGDDTIKGQKGRDKIVGGKGGDTIYGGATSDTIDGGGGRDEIRGGNGDDSIIGGAGRDELRGNSGNDTIDARDGVSDVVNGGSGDGDVASVDDSDAVTNVETVAKPGGDAAAIDAYVRGLDYNPNQLMAVVQDGAQVSEPDSKRTLGSESVIITTYRNVDLRKNLSELVLMRPTSGVIYPGALVIGDRDLKAGQPKPLPAGIRPPITISVDLPGHPNSSRTVAAPTNSTVQDAVNSLTAEWNATAYQEGYVNAARSILEVENAYTSRQIALDLGFSADWASGSAQVNTQIANTSERTTAMAYYKQVFYTVAVDTPNRPSDMFGSGVTVASLAQQVDETNPPAYVRSVDYGRLVMVKMETSAVSTSVDVQGALDAVMGFVDTSTTIDAKYDSLVKTSKFSVVAIGGGAQIAATFEPSNQVKLQTMADYIKNGAVYRVDNPGAPISYTVVFLKDHKIATMGFTTEFQQAESVVHPNGFIKVWNDGGYVARFYVYYKEFTGDPNDDATWTWTEKRWGSGNMTNPEKAPLYLPGDVKEVRVRADSARFIGTWHTIETRPLGDGPPNKCYAARGLLYGERLVEVASCD